MLPVSFQMPAGILLVLAGLVSCFAGYRLFRVVLGMFGFIVGWLFVSSAMGTEQTLWMLLAAIGGGLVGRADPRSPRTSSASRSSGPALAPAPPA